MQNVVVNQLENKQKNISFREDLRNTSGGKKARNLREIKNLNARPSDLLRFRDRIVLVHSRLNTILEK
jgi:hypothetical protein